MKRGHGSHMALGLSTRGSGVSSVDRGTSQQDKCVKINVIINMDASLYVCVCVRVYYMCTLIQTL